MNRNIGTKQISSEHIVGTVLIRLLVAAVIVTAVVALSGTAFAQRTTGTLRGQVLDPQGAVVADARVTVLNQATGVEQSVSTSSAGTYSLPSVLPGSYTVTVEAKGFKKAVHKDVPVLADQENVADSKLEVGSNTEVVEVMAGAAQVETTSSAINNNFDSRDVLNVPVAGGAVYSALNLAILAPNTVAQPGGTAGTGGAIGGTRPRDNSFSVDGVDDNNLGVTGPNSTVIFDAIQEFALQTNQFSAEYGHSAGGQFNLVTKTGTNNYHGSGEWYSQNRNFNSLDNLTKSAIEQNTPGLSSMPAYDNNRFGGTFGGPIIKNKWFFFGAYEYTDLHGAGTPTSINMPTSDGMALLQGMAVDSQVSSLLNNFPLATTADPDLAICVHCPVDSQNKPLPNIPVGKLTIVSPLLQQEHDAQFNTDYTWGHHQIGTRFLLNQEKTLFPVNSTQSLFNQNLLVRNRKIALTDAWSLKNNMVNDLRLQYSYYSQNFANPCGSSCPPDITLLDLGDPTVGPADVQTQKQTTYQIVDNVSWVHGKHTFKFGGQYTHFIYPQFFLPRSLGDYWYNTTQEFIDDLEPGNQGRTLRGAGSGSFLGTQSLLAAFVQDDIKVTPRLTLNLGLRYEYWTNPVGDSTQQLNAISNVPGVINFGVPKTDKNNIGPRIGFAYDPTGSGKTAIRGGFGVSYDVKFQNFASITLPPQLSTELDIPTACTLNPTPSWCATKTAFLAGGGLPQNFPIPATAADARALTTAFIDDTVMPKIFTWSLGVQHEVYRNSTIEVRYLGTRGLELPVQYRRNFISYFDAGGTPLPMFFSASSIPATFDSSTPTDAAFYTFASNYGNCGTTDPLLPTPGLTQSTPDIYQQYGFCGNVTSDPPRGNSIYHAGSVNFTHRAGHGFTFNANYTYAHTISNSDNEFNTSSLNPRRSQDTNLVNQDRSNSDLDVTHKVAVSLTYDLPKTRAENAVMKALLNGYSIGSSFLAQSGQPVTLQSGIDSNGNVDSAGDRVIFNPTGTGNVLGEDGQGDVFPVCASTAGTTSGVPVGNTYIGATSFLNAPLNGCADNSSANFGSDPAIGFTPVNPNDRYVVAAGGVQSNVGRNSFRSPGFYTVNLSLSKNIHFTESKYLQLQASAFNVFNHPNYALSNGNVFGNGGISVAQATHGYVLPFDGTFLQPQQFGGGIRSMILALKFVF
jgi:hypothetical protein